MVGHTQSVRNLFTDCVVLYYTKELCCTLSGICHMHITERRNKRKGLKGPSKYNFYCGPTKDPMLIQHLTFIKPGMRRPQAKVHLFS